MTDNLTPGESLKVNERLYSSNRKMHLTLQGDGNVVLVQDSNDNPWYSTNTAGKPVTHLDMQSDGNLVAYGDDGHAYWDSGTNHAGSSLELQNDGNLVIYAPNHISVWDTGSNVLDPDPFVCDTGDVNVNHTTGHWMRTKGSMSASGLISATTRTWCTILGAGWTGSVFPVLLDTQGRTVWPPDLQAVKHRFGVNGSAIPGVFGPTDRNDAWSVQVPAGVIPQASSLAFVHFPDPKDLNLSAILSTAEQIGEIVGVIIALVGAAA